MKTCAEWSAAFDLVYNNITSNQAPGLDSYEKSVYLTMAQADVVKEYAFKHRGDLLEGIDSNPRRQSDFSSLIRFKVLPPKDYATPFDSRGIGRHYEYPDDVLLVLNEQVHEASNCNERIYVVVPISYEEYDRLMQKPYKYPPKGKIWRLIVGSDENPVIELVGRPLGLIAYHMRYVKRPSPIILETLSGETIEGESAQATSKVPEHLHDEILHRAAQLAKAAWLGTTGDASRTEN